MDEITVVIPTALLAARAVSLKRAVESILEQPGVRALPLLVVNGPRYDRELLRVYEEDPRVNTRYLEEPSLPAAIRHGRSCVETPYFSFLDDDDLYEPDTLRHRLSGFSTRDEPASDIIVCNGFRESAKGLERCHQTMAAYANDPLRSLTSTNWLASCAGTFRTSTVGVEYFDGKTKHLEWTTTAFRCALKLAIRFTDTMGYRICDTDVSLSKSDAYRQGVIDALDLISKLELPLDVRDAVLRARGDAFHELSDHLMSTGQLKRAWAAHAGCLKSRGGSRYLRFTARLLATSVFESVRSRDSSASS